MASELTIQLTPQLVRPSSPVTAARPLEQVSGRDAPQGFRSEKEGQYKNTETGQSGISESELPRLVGQLNELVQAIRRELEFSVDEQSGRTVITVVDAETREVIRQIPPEEVLTLVGRLGRPEPGLISETA
jgi:flagellar protein FlaG